MRAASRGRGFSAPCAHWRFGLTGTPVSCSGATGNVQRAEEGSNAQQ